MPLPSSLTSRSNVRTTCATLMATRRSPQWNQNRAILADWAECVSRSRFSQGEGIRRGRKWLWRNGGEKIMERQKEAA